MATPTILAVDDNNGNTIRCLASSGPLSDWRSAFPLRKSSDPIAIIGSASRQRSPSMSRSHDVPTSAAQPLFVSGTATAASPDDEVSEPAFGMDMVDALSQMSFARHTPDPLKKRNGAPITPLALFSTCGSMSPGGTPRTARTARGSGGDLTPPPSPPQVPNPASPKRVQSPQPPLTVDTPAVSAAGESLPRAKSDQNQSPRKKMFQATKLQLKKLMPGTAAKKNALSQSAERVLSKKQLTALPTSNSERHATETAIGEQSNTPRANSAPTSPGRVVVVMNEQTIFDDEPPRPNTARQRSNTRDSSSFINVDEDTPFQQFFAALRGDSASEQDESSLSSVSESGSFSSAGSTDRSKKRMSMQVKQNATNSPRIGVRAVFDLDSSTNQPIVRVRSHSSIDELKRRLVAEADAAAPIPPDRRNTSTLAASIEQLPEPDTRSSSSSSPSTRTNTSSNGSESTEDMLADAQDALGRSARSPKPKRVSLTMKKKVKYTMIEYNPDPLGLAPWQRFLVPNSEIDTNMRTFLERASRSEELGEPFRICQCKPGCSEHLSPDMVAKFAAVFVVEPRKCAPNAVERALAQKQLRRGCWAEAYRVQNGNQTNFEKTPCTFHYRYKMFV